MLHDRHVPLLAWPAKLMLLGLAGSVTAAMSLWLGIDNIRTAVLVVTLAELFVLACIVLVILCAERVTSEAAREDEILTRRSDADLHLPPLHARSLPVRQVPSQIQAYLLRVYSEMQRETASAGTPPESAERQRRPPASGTPSAWPPQHSTSAGDVRVFRPRRAA